MQLLERARECARTVPGGAVVLGADAEWGIRPTGVRTVAVIQLATTDGFTVVFHIKPDERKDGIVPTALRELLEKEDVLLVSTRSFGLQANALAWNRSTYTYFMTCLHPLGCFCCGFRLMGASGGCYRGPRPHSDQQQLRRDGH